MARFLTELIVKKRPDNLWELTEDLEYRVGSEDSKEIIIVRKGMSTDFASIPWGLRNLLPKDSYYTNGSVLHDALYRYRGMLPAGWFSGPEKIYSQKDCDSIFLEAMQVLGVPWWKRNIMYLALRAFGWISFKKNSPGRTPPEASQI